MTMTDDWTFTLVPCAQTSAGSSSLSPPKELYGNSFGKERLVMTTLSLLICRTIWGMTGPTLEISLWQVMLSSDRTRTILLRMCRRKRKAGRPGGIGVPVSSISIMMEILTSMRPTDGSRAKIPTICERHSTPVRSHRTGPSQKDISIATHSLGNGRSTETNEIVFWSTLAMASSLKGLQPMGWTAWGMDEEWPRQTSIAMAMWTS